MGCRANGENSILLLRDLRDHYQDSLSVPSELKRQTFRLFDLFFRIG